MEKTKREIAIEAMDEAVAALQKALTAAADAAEAGDPVVGAATACDDALGVLERWLDRE